MTCREFADFMADYLSGELSVEVRQRFDHHLSICPNCQHYLSSYAESVKLGKRAFDDEAVSLPGDVPEDLVQAILASRRRSSGRRWRPTHVVAKPAPPSGIQPM